MINSLLLLLLRNGMEQFWTMKNGRIVKSKKIAFASKIKILPKLLMWGTKIEEKVSFSLNLDINIVKLILLNDYCKKT